MKESPAALSWPNLVPPKGVTLRAIAGERCLNLRPALAGVQVTLVADNMTGLALCLQYLLDHIGAEAALMLVNALLEREKRRRVPAALDLAGGK